MAYSYEFEPINGNFFQTIGYYYKAYKPVNGSWIQAICEANGYTEPINGSWLNTFAILTYDSSELKYPLDPETGDYYYDLDGNPISIPFELINGNFWQSILYYSLIDEQYFLDNFELNVAFPINGSWANTYYQYLRNSNEGDIIQPGAILSLSEPTWSGTAAAGNYGIIINDIPTNGDGLGLTMIINFMDGQIFYFNITSFGSGYKVGDTLTIPSLTIPGVTGDIVFTVLEVLEY
jgi:hypothetical protein